MGIETAVTVGFGGCGKPLQRERRSGHRQVSAACAFNPGETDHTPVVQRNSGVGRGADCGSADGDETTGVLSACRARRDCNDKRGETQASRDITNSPASGHFRPQRVTPVKRNDSMRQHCGAHRAAVSLLLNSV